ncbi:maleylacetate reductase [Burkholderiaceae bacterium FT117]|uniref:maleylacetate reductase n=1 Tax=Zeimonas sediminis TaxID=2944268 RepID=UPI002342F49F|nr:maleylacetate reductase [Zeimonas sediminis]MCM5571533.1 maleylacetate reductase [Zeimonas sediminis]
MSRSPEMQRSPQADGADAGPAAALAFDGRTRFTYTGFAARVLFGDGSLAALPDEVERLGARRALVLCTPEQREAAERAAAQLGDRAAGIHDRAAMHVPLETAIAARDEAARLGADCCVAVGGGSTVGLGKAIALTSGLPIVAVPSTFAGSEMTAIWGLTEGGVKKTGRDPKVLPRTVIYDPVMLETLPAKIAGPSGMNAIAHCVEALYAVDANPIVSMIAEEGIRALAESLPTVIDTAVTGEQRRAALGLAQYGAWLAGTALNGVSMAIHHKLCHTLGGSFNLGHAETHTVVLPYATAYNREAAPQAMQRIRRALGRFGDGDAATGLQALARALGAPTSLREIGMPADGLDRAADLAVQNPYWNPRPIERDAIRSMLDDAWHGRAPR